MGYRSAAEEHQIRSQQIASEDQAKEQAVLVQQQELRDKQEARREDNIKEFVPKLVGEDRQARLAARAVLVAIYENDADRILDDVENVVPQSEGLKNPLLEAQKLGQQTGLWGIVAYHRNTSDEAVNQCQQAMKDNLVGSCLIFHRSGFVVVVGPFPTNDDAQVAAISVRSFQNKTAYVVNLKSYCPAYKPDQGPSGVAVTECKVP
jgi:hypothetical protein